MAVIPVDLWTRSLALEGGKAFPIASSVQILRIGFGDLVD